MPLANSEIYRDVLKVKVLSPPMYVFVHSAGACCVLSSLIDTENMVVNWTDETLGLMEL